MSRLKDAERRWQVRFGPKPVPPEVEEPVPIGLDPYGVRRTASRAKDQAVVLPIEVQTALDAVTASVGAAAHAYVAQAKLLSYATVLLIGTWGGRLEHVVAVAEDQLLASIEGQDALPAFNRMPGQVIRFPRLARREVPNG